MTGFDWMLTLQKHLTSLIYTAVNFSWEYLQQTHVVENYYKI